MVSHSLSAPIACAFVSSTLILITSWNVSHWWILHTPFSSLVSTFSFFFCEFISSLNIYPHLGFLYEFFSPVQRPLCLASVSVICWMEPHSKAQYSVTHPGLLCWLLALQQDPSCFPDLRLVGNNLPWTKEQIICLCRFWKQVMANQCSIPRLQGESFLHFPGPGNSKHFTACGCLASISTSTFSASTFSPSHPCVCVPSSSYNDRSHWGPGGQEHAMSSPCP